MSNLIRVTFDTNVYRTLILSVNDTSEILNLGKKVIDICAQNNFKINLDFTVLEELFRHLETPQSKDGDKCMKSFKLILNIMFLQKNHNVKASISCLHSWTSNLGYCLLGDDRNLSDYHQSFINLFAKLSPNQNLENLDRFEEYFSSLKCDWQKNRESFIKSIQNMFQVEEQSAIFNKWSLTNKDKTNDIMKLLYCNFIQWFIDSYGSKEKLKNDFDFPNLYNNLTPAFYFLALNLDKIKHGLNQSNNQIFENKNHKRWNFLSDFFIMLNSLLCQNILVTNEFDIIESYSQCQKQSSVIDYVDIFSDIKQNNRKCKPNSSPKNQ